MNVCERELSHLLWRRLKPPRFEAGNSEIKYLWAMLDFSSFFTAVVTHTHRFPATDALRVINIPRSRLSLEDILSIVRLDAFRFSFIQEDEMLVYYFIRINLLLVEESI
ncbi:hypothetical protein CDAR_33311 [Caerostris darwini]|uniref:Uncharacterized protein n=1 Tax=Caerostris darwini TaxID=1538125 RepID=A0AAV4X5B1_9ARAC|nr:hypothetical protein CDAR_33311 [Caerostris darwini]